MIDFHSHILPGIDDGSSSIQETIQMLTLEKQMGVSTIVASPHFYSNKMTIDQFVENRNNAYNQVLQSVDLSIDIKLGAEVFFFHGMSNTVDITRLCIEGTNTIMIEMPFCSWTESHIQELMYLQKRCTVLLAHIERYMSFDGNIAKLIQLLEMGFFSQVNASYFIEFKKKRKAIRQFKDGFIHVLGSDCHNMTTRLPNIEEAYIYIHKKLGRSGLEEIESNGKYLLK